MSIAPPTPDFTNLGRWQAWYQRITSPRPMGARVTYQKAADWLAPCATVEDWGCGPGGARAFFPAGVYRGLDGTLNPYVDQLVDLVRYRSVPPVDGILLRHVLEHNYDWRSVLTNALASFRLRACIIHFVPFEAQERVRYVTRVGIPVIALEQAEFERLVTEAGVTIVSSEQLRIRSEFNVEHIYYLAKP